LELTIGNTEHNFSGSQYSMTDMIVKYIAQCDVCRFKAKSRSAFDVLEVLIPDVHAFDRMAEFFDDVMHLRLWFSYLNPNILVFGSEKSYENCSTRFLQTSSFKPEID
jgi:hypothetical protein